MAARSLIVLLALAFVPAPSLAANPLDNDAGSGGDASDVAASALLLEPGSYAGRLAPKVDEVDWYAFEAEAQTLVRMRLDTMEDTSAWLYAPFDDATDPLSSTDVFGFLAEGEENRFLLPVGGTWRFSVTVDTAFAFLPNNYGITFTIETPAGFTIAQRTNGWETFEMRWSEPTTVYGLDRTMFLDHPTEPYAYLSALEITRPDGPSLSALSVVGSALGTTVKVPPLAVHVPLPTLQPADPSGIVTLSVYTNVTAMRLTHYQTGSQQPLSY